MKNEIEMNLRHTTRQYKSAGKLIENMKKKDIKINKKKIKL
jgi:hypothetical protein